MISLNIIDVPLIAPHIFFLFKPFDGLAYSLLQTGSRFPSGQMPDFFIAAQKPFYFAFLGPEPYIIGNNPGRRIYGINNSLTQFSYGNFLL